VAAAAQSAVAAQRMAYQAAMVATMAAKDAVRELREQCGSAVRSIRAFADTQPQPNEIYVAAQISQPDAPSPTPPPAQPQRLKVTLGATPGIPNSGPNGNNLAALANTGTGAITLRWKCRNPPGTSNTTYLVRRRLPGEAAFTFIGATGKKAFVDVTLPAGAAHAEYTVQGQRGSRVGRESEIYTMHIGALGPRAASMATDSVAMHVERSSRLRHADATAVGMAPV